MRGVTGKGFSYLRGPARLNSSDSSRDVTLFTRTSSSSSSVWRSRRQSLLVPLPQHRKLMVILSNSPAVAAIHPASCHPGVAPIQVNDPNLPVTWQVTSSAFKKIAIAWYTSVKLYRTTEVTPKESSGRRATRPIATLLTLQMGRLLFGRP